MTDDDMIVAVGIESTARETAQRMMATPNWSKEQAKPSHTAASGEERPALAGGKGSTIARSL